MYHVLDICTNRSICQNSMSLEEEIKNTSYYTFHTFCTCWVNQYHWHHILMYQFQAKLILPFSCRIICISVTKELYSVFSISSKSYFTILLDYICTSVTIDFKACYLSRLSYHVDNSWHIFFDLVNTVGLSHHFLHHNHGLDRSLLVR